MFPNFSQVESIVIRILAIVESFKSDEVRIVCSHGKHGLRFTPHLFETSQGKTIVLSKVWDLGFVITRMRNVEGCFSKKIIWDCNLHVLYHKRNIKQKIIALRTEIPKS